VIDTLNRSLTGSENSDEDMGNYVKAADAIHEAFACAVLVVHHCGIEGSRPRGHTSLTGAADAQIAVNRDKNGNASARVEYMKDGPEGAEIAFQLEQVHLGTDEDRDPITSCVVIETEPTGTATTTSQPKLGKNEKTMLDILSEHMPLGLTKAEWHELGREDGIGKSRRSDLGDCRRSLVKKDYVHETQEGRWCVTKI